MPELDDKMKNEASRIAIEDKERADALRSLVKHPGWPYYQELLGYHINARTQRLFEPIPDNGVMEEQHNKGVVYGLIFARDLPEVIINSMSPRDGDEEE